MQIGSISNAFNVGKYQKKFEEFNNAFADHLALTDPKVQQLTSNLKRDFGVSNIKHMNAVNISYEDLMGGNDIFRPNKEPYTVKENLGFNASKNSISIVPGLNIPFASGINIKIQDSGTTVEYSGSVNGSVFEDAITTASALDRFIKYANGQSGSLGFDNDKRSSVVSLLNKIGIDTSKEFYVNGTAFNTSDYKRLEKSGVVNPTFTLIPEYQMKLKIDQLVKNYGIDFDWGYE